MLTQSLFVKSIKLSLKKDEVLDIFENIKIKEKIEDLLEDLIDEAKIDKELIIEDSDEFNEQDFSKERFYNITRLSFTASNKTEIGESSKIDFDENKPIYVIYTSGTTGKAKGVIVSYFHFFTSDIFLF